MKKFCAIALLLFQFLSVHSQEVSNGLNNAHLLDLLENQRYGDAANYLKTVYQEPITDRKVLSRFGYSLQMAGRLAEAETYYARILEQDSTEIRVLFSVATINQRKGN